MRLKKGSVKGSTNTANIPAKPDMESNVDIKKDSKNEDEIKESCNKASKDIKSAIDALGPVAKKSVKASEAIANLAVILMDIQD